MAINFPYQVGVSAEGELVPIRRYAIDLCSCGHPWSDHWQPRRGGKASCWSTPKKVLCECHDFELSTSRNAGKLLKD